MYIGKKRTPLSIILLSFVTCGIYMFFWHYTIMDDLNNTSEKEIMNPTMYLVLSIFCAPVMFLIWYNVDRQLAKIAKEEGIEYKENFVIWVLFSLIGGIGSLIAMFQIQGAFNDIWDKRAERTGLPLQY